VAVDTAEKRFSMLNLTIVGASMMLFERDGTVNDDDRQHLIGCYSGIALDEPPGINQDEFRHKYAPGMWVGCSRGMI